MTVGTKLQCVIASIVLAACGRTGLYTPHVVAAQIVSPGDPPSNYGTDFWVVSTVNSLLDGQNRFDFAVAIGNAGTTTAHVTIDGGTLRTPLTVDVPAGSSTTQILPWVRELSQHSLRPLMGALGMACVSDGEDTTNLVSNSTIPDSTQVAGGAYHVHSTAPVAVYQFNALEYQTMAPGCQQFSYTNDASLVLPETALGRRYLVLTHRAAILSAPSFFAVVGTTDGTTVTVTPSANIKAGPGVLAITAGTATTFTLGAGDVLELMGETDLVTEGGADLSGSEIVASAPVGVFAGVDCARVGGPDDSLAACDHLEQQLPPEGTWGTDVVVTQFRDRGSDEPYRVRVMAQADGTLVHFQPTEVHADVTLNRGEVVTVDDTRDVEVTSSAPILVAQFMVGAEATPDAGLGDPSMVLEVPVAQYRRAYAFAVPATYVANFINVVAPTGATLTLDGIVRSDPRDALGGTPWSILRLPVGAGAHTLSTDAPLGAALKVYGVGRFTSYAYPGGMNVGVQP